MGVETQETHRSGQWKQQNKSHKHGKHRSKGQIERQSQGRVNVKTLSRRNKQQTRKNDRRHQAQQIRKQKRDEVLEKKRNRGSQGSPPHFVVILPLHKDIDCDAVLELLKQCDETAVVSKNEQGICHISVPRFKQRLSFFIPEYGNLHAILDAAKVADSLLCLLSPEGAADSVGEHCISCLYAQGLPAITFGVQGLKTLNAKKQNEAKKTIQRHIDKRFPTEKFHAIDLPQDALLVLRRITNHKLPPVFFRDNRPHMLAESIEFEIDSEESEVGTLKLSGYLRGRSLSANGLIHLPGWGDFQMLQIDAPNDPHPFNQKLAKDSRKQNGLDIEMEGEKEEVRVLEKADPRHQESLQSEVIPDPMEGEQTWPTDAELAEAEKQSKKKVMKKVPKGTSEYQSAWILDDDEDHVGASKAMLDDEEDEDEDEDDVDMEAEEEEDSDGDEEASGDEEFETLTMTENNDAERYDENMDMDEERSMFEKMKEEKLHVMFPDEVDTPMEKVARQRFARYRGLKSFRTTLWDPKENLPLDYARIFQFGNFKKTKKKVLTDDTDSGALPGWFITVHIANVPREFMESYKPGSPVVMFGLLQHEQKMSVSNYVIKRCGESRFPIKSKERLIFHAGFRRFSVCPIFSQHTNGNKHKFERFLYHNVATMATIYGPIMFPPSPVLVFKEMGTGAHELVATGSLSSVNPDRTVVKRVVLSGYPFKINKRTAVIRYMFFNREDIMWFKPVELRTKWGRRGNIRDSLGTHGHMKCVFDGQLKSQDTVLMNLYKRVFPKWTYNPYVRCPPTICDIGDVDDDDDEEEEEDGEDMQAYQMFE
ncbi:pre-rRNA-processing protein TSR1 homolog isoform X2 [Pecten maximus]|uniref:pre-rRNA-processing protein TSR1 homolog isoform X2 n=1 Tax=Pecten maximus TaxID=6579 RepID=UPI001458398D|nr:pre-rRNA-processing protein TSR1 homolog isoform X2 [Pecten maximus]